VSSFNGGALHLYKKFGFELIGELKDFIKPGFTELLLRKTVGAVAGYKAPLAK
jgi:ribosomal-protein-alanine N-acetyltransferase